MDFVNQITLDCLLNKEMYTDHVQHKKNAQINKEDRKLYKKRIFNLFKEIINDSEPEDLPMDIKYTYSNFLMSCIKHFKIKDNNEVIQSEYKDFIFKEENEIIEDISMNQMNQTENNLEADKILVFSGFDENTNEKKPFKKNKEKSKTEIANFMFTKIEVKDK